MTDFGPHIREFLETVKGDIILQLRSQHRIATGKLQRSFRVVANQFIKGELRANNYLEYLQTGIGSKPKGVNQSFLDNIIEWMRAKRIQPRRKGRFVPNTQTNFKRTAYQFAQAIVKRGTAIKRGQRGVSIDQAIKDNQTQLLNDMGLQILKDFQDETKLKTKLRK